MMTLFLLFFFLGVFPFPFLDAVCTQRVLPAVSRLLGIDFCRTDCPRFFSLVLAAIKQNRRFQSHRASSKQEEEEKAFLFSFSRSQRITTQAQELCKRHGDLSLSEVDLPLFGLILIRCGKLIFVTSKGGQMLQDSLMVDIPGPESRNFIWDKTRLDP
jgi:hypothetical protein